MTKLCDDGPTKDPIWSNSGLNLVQLRAQSGPIQGSICYYLILGPNDVEMCDDDPRMETRLEDNRKLLVVTHGEKAEMWHVDYVGKKYGNKPLKAEEVETGCLKVGWRYLH